MVCWTGAELRKRFITINSVGFQLISARGILKWSRGPNSSSIQLGLSWSILWSDRTHPTTTLLLNDKSSWAYKLRIGRLAGWNQGVDWIMQSQSSFEWCSIKVGLVLIRGRGKGKRVIDPSIWLPLARSDTRIRVPVLPWDRHKRINQWLMKNGFYCPTFTAGCGFAWLFEVWPHIIFICRCLVFLILCLPPLFLFDVLLVSLVICFVCAFHFVRPFVRSVSPAFADSAFRWLCTRRWIRDVGHCGCGHPAMNMSL